jgi:release factor glutamine methyltransferase
MEKSDSMSVQTLEQDLHAWITWAEDLFISTGVPTPRIDAEILLAHVLGMKKLDLYLNPRLLDHRDRQQFMDWAQRRSRREPLQYILKEGSFFGRSFEVSREVLIPRPETELLIEECLKRVHHPRRILDVGTGSGCVAVTLACELPKALIFAVDNQECALSMARRNARRHGANRIRWICGDLLHAVRQGSRMDLVVANLPYIPDREIPRLQKEVRDFEPLSALSGGEDGLFKIRALISDVSPVLRPGGLLALEIGHDQGDPVRSLIEATGSFQDVEIVKDLAGYNRMALARKEAQTT